MILEQERLLERVRLVSWGSLRTGQPFDLDVVLYQDTILQDRDVCRPDQFAGFGKARGVIDDVVGLPGPWFTADIHQRRVLFVNSAGLAVIISLVLVGIEHLHFVTPLEVDPAIAPALAIPFDLFRRRPFDMELAIAKSAPG